MFKVKNLNKNGTEIHAEDYERCKDDDLCCPDPQCSARMTYVQESEELATFFRAAHFRTLPNQKHVDGCEAYHEEREFKKRIDSIKDAISKGKKVLLSLNDRQTGYGLPSNLKINFVSQSNPDYASTQLYTFHQQNRGNFVSQSVKKIFSLMTILHTIDQIGGPPAFNNVFFAWQGQVKPYEDFVCDGVEFEKELFKRLYKKFDDETANHRFDAYGHQGAYGFPRMIEFRPSSEAMKNEHNIIFGQQTIVNRDKKSGARLFLKHAIDISKLDTNARQRVLQGKTIRIIATPKVNKTLSRNAFDSFYQGQDSSARLTWNVVGEHQIQVLNPDKKMSGPLPSVIQRTGLNRGQQLNLV